MAARESTDCGALMLRHASHGHIGTTAFFRNRPLLRELTSLLTRTPTRHRRVLFHACSVGAEPYSFALWCKHHKVFDAADSVEIVATDIEEHFLAVARRGVYPAAILEHMTPEERGWFDCHPEGVQVPADVRAMVTFLPPLSFIDGDPGALYDAVLIMNALTYVTPEEQRAAVIRAARHSQRLLCLTAFHPDSIKSDIEAAGFMPWT